jgi:hypothetical protein
MKQIHFYYIFTLIQLITVLFYIEILVKKFKLPCEYGWFAWLFIPIFIIIPIIFFNINEENEETNILIIFFDIILIIFLLPLFAVSLGLGMFASGVAGSGGGLLSYCIKK